MRLLEVDCSTSVQQQSISSTGVQRSKLGGHSELGAFRTVGIQNCWHSELGVQSGRENQPACSCCLLPLCNILVDMPHNLLITSNKI